MQQIARLFLFVALFAFFGGSAHAARIECPLSKARRTITDQLPSEWWTTPIVERLSDTKITNIGGKPALLCVYGDAGSVQRNAPDGQRCRAVRGGFECTGAGRDAGSKPFSTGRLDVPQTYTFDLDRGSVAKKGADFWFEAETRDQLYLVPRNGAAISVGNRSNRGQSGCAAARFSTERVSLRDIPRGSYVCARTSENRISQFRVNSLSGGSSKTLSIGYTTWR